MIINKEEFISTKSRSQRSAAIASYWPRTSETADSHNLTLRIGLVKYLFRHKITLAMDGKTKSVHHTIAHVDWYSDHPYSNYIHEAVVICATVFDPNPIEFLPTSRIIGRAATAKTFNYGEDIVIVAIPLLKKIVF